MFGRLQCSSSRKTRFDCSKSILPIVNGSTCHPLFSSLLPVYLPLLRHHPSHLLATTKRHSPCSSTCHCPDDACSFEGSRRRSRTGCAEGRGDPTYDCSAAVACPAITVVVRRSRGWRCSLADDPRRWNLRRGHPRRRRRGLAYSLHLRISVRSRGGRALPGHGAPARGRRCLRHAP
jgi:hypothetical protein